MLLACLVAGCVIEDEYIETTPPETLTSTQADTIDGLVFCLQAGEPRVVERAELCDSGTPRMIVRSNASDLELVLESEVLSDPTSVILERFLRLQQEDAAGWAEAIERLMQAQQDLLDAAYEDLEQRGEAERAEAQQAAEGDPMEAFVRIMSFFAQDTNLNGVYDLLEDTDGDGIPNFKEDQDSDGIIDMYEDDDGDGVPNPMDDDDNDSVMNVVDQCPTQAGDPLNDGCPTVIGEVLVVVPSTTTG
jgi:hypothetical protein